MSKRARKNTLENFLLILGFGFLGLALLLVLFGNELVERTRPQLSATSVLDQVQPRERGTPIATLNARTQPVTVEVGDQALPFTLSDLEGNEVALADFRGQHVIINFWATWCGPCIFEMPELQATYEAHRGDGVVVLGLNRDEDPAIVREFLQNDLDTSISFPILLDEHATVANRYSVYNLPTTYFINPDGIVTAIHRGPLTQEQIESYLAEGTT